MSQRRTPGPSVPGPQVRCRAGRVRHEEYELQHTVELSGVPEHRQEHLKMGVEEVHPASLRRDPACPWGRREQEKRQSAPGEARGQAGPAGRSTAKASGGLQQGARQAVGDPAQDGRPDHDRGGGPFTLIRI